MSFLHNTHESAGELTETCKHQLHGVAAAVGLSLINSGTIKAYVYFWCQDETPHNRPELLPHEPVRARGPRDAHDVTEPTI